MPSNLAEFVRDLHSDDKEVRMYSIRSIAQLGPAAADAIPELVTLFDDPDEDIAALYLRAVAFFGPDISSP